MANHIQRAYKLKLDAKTVIGSTGEGRLTVYNEDGVTPTVDLSELSIEVATLTNCAPCYADIGVSNFDLNSSAQPYSVETTTRITASGTVYLWATGATLAAPTISQITGSSFTFSADGGVDTTHSITNLDPNTSYKIYAYAVDAEGNDTVIGGNGTKFTATTPESISITNFSLEGSSQTSSINTTITTSDDGIIYLKAAEQGDSAPTVSQIKSSAFTGEISADTATSINLGGLSAATAYTAYAYAENSAGQGTIIGNSNTLFNFTTNSAITFQLVSHLGGNNESLSHRVIANADGTGYLWGTGSGLAAPSVSQMEANAYVTGALTSGIQNTLLSVAGLNQSAPNTIYAYIKNNEGNSIIGAVNSFYSSYTYLTPTPRLVGQTGSAKPQQFSMYYEVPVDSTVYFTPYESGAAGPTDPEDTPYTTSMTAGVRETFTFTGLTSDTIYNVYIRDVYPAGGPKEAVAAGGGQFNTSSIFSFRTPSQNQNLISNGLMGRFFGWNNPDYIGGSDYETATVLEGGSITPSSHDVITSTIDFGDSKTLTGVFKNMAYNRTSATGTNGFVMTGIEFDGNNDHITLPQLQNNSKGAWDTDFEFLEGNSTDDAAYGFSITFWIKPKWGIDHGPSSNQDYKPWNLGNSSARSLGLYHKFDGSDRPAQLRGNSSNFAYSDSASNPPDPWDELYDEDNWTFMSIVYNGQELAPGYSADKASSAFMVAVGTGLPSAGDIFFYSGDGSAAGLADDFTVQGSNYAGYGSTSNSFLDMTQNYCATIGTALKSDGSLQNNDLSYWPGYICDFRLYNRQITTGEIFSIFTGAGVT